MDYLSYDSDDHESAAGWGLRNIHREWVFENLDSDGRHYGTLYGRNMDLCLKEVMLWDSSDLERINGGVFEVLIRLAKFSYSAGNGLIIWKRTGGHDVSLQINLF